MGETLYKHLLLDPSDVRWWAFVESNPQANAFHHPAWINLLAECYGYRPLVLTVCDATGSIGAGLPIMEINSSLTGRRWVSLPFTDHCAPLYRDCESLDQLIRELVRLYQDGGAPRIEVRWDLVHPAIQTHSPYVLHTLRLDADAARVADHFDRTHRQNIRAAEKSQIYVQWGKQLKDLRAYFNLQLETRHRQGIPSQPWRYFKALASVLFEEGLGSVLLAYKDGQCLAGIVLLHWQRTLIGKYAASREESLKLRPNHLLIWTAIRWGCEHGYTVFDMGRTDLENAGLRRFKRGWGAEETPLTYSTLFAQASRPMTSRLMTSKLMPILQTVIRKSPLWVCRVLGELLYEQVG